MNDEVRVDLPPPHYSDELNRLASIYRVDKMSLFPTICEKIPPLAPNWGEFEVWCTSITPTDVSFSVRLTFCYEVQVYATLHGRGMWQQTVNLSALHTFESKDSRCFIEEEIEQAHDKIQRLPQGLRKMCYQDQADPSTINELMRDWPPVVQERYVAATVAAELEGRR